MKIKILSIVFFSLYLLLTTNINCFAQDEAAYQKALSQAATQENPSEYRASILKMYLDEADNVKNAKGYKMSERELNEFVANKLKELMRIDFYAAFLVQKMQNAGFIKWNEILELIPVEQVAAFKKLEQWKKKGGTYPADLPKPGFGWVKTTSKVQPQNTANNNPPTKSSPAVTDRSNVKPTTAEEAFSLGNRQFDDKDYAAAIRSYTDCIRFNAKAEGCYLNRAMAYQKTENHDAAINDFTRAIQLNPKSETAYSLRAVSFNTKKNYDSAIADLETALKLKPDNPKVVNLLATLKKLRQAKNELDERREKAIGFLETGKRYMGEKKYDEVVLAFTNCFEADPLLFDCLRNRAVGYIQLGDYTSAVGDYTFLIEKAPDAKLYYSRAMLYLELGVWETASDDFTKAIDLNPGEADYYLGRGQVFQQTLNRESAIADYRKALELNPKLSQARQKLEELGIKP